MIIKREGENSSLVLESIHSQVKQKQNGVQWDSLVEWLLRMCCSDRTQCAMTLEPNQYSNLKSFFVFFFFSGGSQEDELLEAEEFATAIEFLSNARINNSFDFLQREQKNFLSLSLSLSFWLSFYLFSGVEIRRTRDFNSNGLFSLDPDSSPSSSSFPSYFDGWFFDKFLRLGRKEKKRRKKKEEIYWLKWEGRLASGGIHSFESLTSFDMQFIMTVHRTSKVLKRNIYIYIYVCVCLCFFLYIYKKKTRKDLTERRRKKNRYPSEQAS